MSFLTPKAVPLERAFATMDLLAQRDYITPPARPNTPEGTLLSSSFNLQIDHAALIKLIREWREEVARQYDR